MPTDGEWTPPVPDRTGRIVCRMQHCKRRFKPKYPLHTICKRRCAGL